MNATRTKQVLAAAAKLPPAKGRALVAAVMAADAPKPLPVPDTDELLGQIADALGAVMEAAMLAELAAD